MERAQQVPPPPTGPLAQAGRLPDGDRLAVITAAVMLAYAVTPFIHLPPQTLSAQLPGFLFEISLDFGLFTSAVAAVLAASGTQWLLTSHPRFVAARRARHWILPALTALIIGFPLNVLEPGLVWWGIFLLGSLFLMGIFTSEYIASDPSDPRYFLVTALLGTLSLALFVLFTIALRAAGLRLFLVLPALALGVFLLTLRTLYLQAGERWILTWPAAIALVVAQTAAGLHYWRISPLQYGLVLAGLTAALISWAVSWEKTAGRPAASHWVEPLTMLGLSLVAALLIRG